MYINTHVYELSLKTCSPNLGPIQYCVAPHARLLNLNQVNIFSHLTVSHCKACMGETSDQERCKFLNTSKLCRVSGSFFKETGLKAAYGNTTMPISGSLFPILLNQQG
jgi:hypothetical protein